MTPVISSCGSKGLVKYIADCILYADVWRSTGRENGQIDVVGVLWALEGWWRNGTMRVDTGPLLLHLGGFEIGFTMGKSPHTVLRARAGSRRATSYS